MKTNSDDRFLSIAAFAERTSLSEVTVRRLCASGKVACVKVGRRRLIPYSELLRIGNLTATAPQAVERADPTSNNNSNPTASRASSGKGGGNDRTTS